MRHFLNLIDLSADELRHLLAEAARLKTALTTGTRPPLLERRVLGLVFEKPSLRTRVSFEAAMAQLGGSTVFLSAQDGPLGKRESVADYARTLSQYADIVALRVFSHKTLEEFATHSAVPVINALSDYSHPCQALGDLLTIQELFGDVRGKTLVFVGDGNNVARSLAVGCGLLGARFVLSAPNGYGFEDSFLKRIRTQVPGADVIVNGSPAHSVGDADVIYTDVWTSMGQEAERTQRQKEFAGYQVNEQLLALAPAHTRVMHCLPANRGEEVSTEAIDGDRSVVFQQAGNRMHVQKVLLAWLLEMKGK
jgi:ornithine carbamoyltransferase